MNINKRVVMTAVRIHPGFPSHHRGDDQYVGAVGFKNYLRFGCQAVKTEHNDFVFGAEISQEIIFEFSIQRYIDRFLKGHDVSIVAYGDHYTGKSYTVFGPGFNYTDSELHFGMLPRSVSYIFSTLEPYKSECDTCLPPHLKISMFELFGIGMKDLLDTSSEVVPHPTLTTNEKGLSTFNVVKRDCFSAMQAMQIITFGMNQRSIHPQTMQHLGTVMVKLELHRPEVKGAEVGLQSQILFVDLACHYVVHPVTRNSIHFDIHVLTLLANVQSNTVPTDETNLFQGCLHFKVFQDFFKEQMDSLFICCISPRRSDIQLTTLYMSVLWHIYKNKPMPNATETDNSQTDELHCEPSTMLMAQAERLFSQLSTSSSVGDEEREMMRMWIDLKQKIIDETANPQSHPQLERIEEVTESEEELASSDERNTDQDNSEDVSAHDSDQEELDQKVCLLSESDFLENVEDVHETFCSYVDNQVDTLIQPVPSPPRDQKPSCSATRRDMQDLPITAPQKIWVQDGAQVTQAENASGHLLTPQEKNRNNGVLNNQPKSDLGSPHPVEPDRLQLEFSRHCNISSNENSVNVSQGLVVEENDLLTNLVNIQYKFQDLVRKCQDVVPLKTLPSSSEEAKASSFTKAMKTIEDNISLLQRLVSSNGKVEEDSMVSGVHRLRHLRSVREKVQFSKSKLDAKIKSKVYYNEDLRSYLIADEMVEVLDRTNEVLNCLHLKNEIPYSQHNQLETWKMTEDVIHDLLLPCEVKQLLVYYFIKVVDLRESTLALESSLSAMEQSLHTCQLKINSMGSTILNLRNLLSGPNEVDCYRPHTNKVPTNTLAMADGAGEGACGGAGSSTIPQQNLSKLQVGNCGPPPRVMRSQNNKKLVVEVNRKKR